MNRPNNDAQFSEAEDPTPSVNANNAKSAAASADASSSVKKHLINNKKVKVIVCCVVLVCVLVGLVVGLCVHFLVKQDNVSSESTSTTADSSSLQTTDSSPTDSPTTDAPVASPTNDPEAVFAEEDPFNNANPDDANLWKTKQGTSGLELTIVNALDAKWSPYFFQAVQQWDDGTPDALNLTIQNATQEPVCGTERGVMKVCNGNYGATQWRGITKVLLENGWIYATASRMNDYYFNNTTEDNSDLRAYTMCHQIGHSLGLPHTDEDFNNKDLGNCMDYTKRPENNKQPAEPNFVFLAQLYGTVDGSPIPETSSLGLRGNNGLRGLSSKKLPPAVAAALQDIDDWMGKSGVVGTAKEGWRQLHESRHGEAHEIDLGHGFTVQLHVLKAQGL